MPNDFECSSSHLEPIPALLLWLSCFEYLLWTGDRSNEYYQKMVNRWVGFKKGVEVFSEHCRGVRQI